MRVRNRSTVRPSGFGASDMQPIGHQYRLTVDFIPCRQTWNNGLPATVSPTVPSREAVIMLQSDRREFLKLAGMAGVTFTAGLFAAERAAAQTDFHFVQFSDTHWGYSGPANPDAEHTLAKAVATVNGLSRQPDFIVFTGDLTHTTDDPKLRRERMKRFREIVSALAVKDVRFMPGE